MRKIFAVLLGLALVSGCSADRGAPEAAKPVPAIASDCSSGYLALTFDDGPTEKTPELLSALDSLNVPATFFNLGSAEQTWPGNAELIASKHDVGNHTWDHPDLLTTPDSLGQIKRALDQHVLIDGSRQNMFRPPFGNTNAAIRAKAKSLGMTEVLWQIDSKDYEAKTSEEIVDKVRDYVAHDGDIILMHDGKPLTIEALPGVVGHFHSQKFCFGKITESAAPVNSELNIPFNAVAVKP